MAQGFTKPIPMPLSVAQGGTGNITAATARTALSAAALGANSDITSMTGLTGFLQAPVGIKSSAGVQILTFQYIASAVNYIGFSNNITGNAPVMSAGGADTNVDLLLSAQGTGGVQLKGTGTNNNAPTGYVGEYISSSVLSGSAVSLTSAVPANITSISLTAGDWEVAGTVASLPNAATTTSRMVSGISRTSATFETVGAENNIQIKNETGSAGQTFAMGVGPMRISVSATTTVYLLMNCTFAISTLSGYGFIGARRVR